MTDLAPCFWDGKRPCSHDRDAPLPRPRPLAAWLSGHPCIQRADDRRWDGSPMTSVRSLSSSVSQRRRFDRAEL